MGIPVTLATKFGKTPKLNPKKQEVFIVGPKTAARDDLEREQATVERKPERGEVKRIRSD
jgi:hypothetical protein